MTAPRQVLAGTCWFISRRCLERRFFLRPSALLTQLFVFLLAVAARRYDIDIHAYCVMSNHFHLILTDRKARLPAFHQYLDSQLARAVNALLGRWGNFWDNESYSAVELTTPEAILEKTAYVLANPVSEGLVRCASSWPGAWSDPARIGGEPLEVRRPDHYFDPKGPQPETALLAVTTPPGFESAEDFRRQVEEALALKEAEAGRKWGGRFLGVLAVQRTDPNSRPADAERRRGLKPRIAVRETAARVAAIERLVRFLRDYRRAWAARRAGDKSAIFPVGTYLLRVLHDVPCEGLVCAGAG